MFDFLNEFFGSEVRDPSNLTLTSVDVDGIPVTVGFMSVNDVSVLDVMFSEDGVNGPTISFQNSGSGWFVDPLGTDLPEFTDPEELDLMTLMNQTFHLIENRSI